MKAVRDRDGDEDTRAKCRSEESMHVAAPAPLHPEVHAGALLSALHLISPGSCRLPVETAWSQTTFPSRLLFKVHSALDLAVLLQKC